MDELLKEVVQYRQGCKLFFLRSVVAVTGMGSRLSAEARLTKPIHLIDSLISKNRCLICTDDKIEKSSHMFQNVVQCP